MEFMDVITKRRSIRKYKPDMVSDADIEYVLECARLAPSWKNSQCWKFIVVKDEKVKEKLVDKGEFRRAKEFYKGQLMLALEDTLEHMFWIGETTATLDKTYSITDMIKEIGQVNREDVREAAGQIFQEKKMNLALIGPLKEKQEQIQNRLNL